jgi:dienelactone hydrolase
LLSGVPAHGLEQATWGDLKVAVEQFHAADGGVLDAATALDFALQRFTEINPGRIGCAGHSSAGMHALLLARKEPRIKACCAYAPSLDVPDHVNKYFSKLKQLVPELDSWAQAYNPVRPHVPTLLFSAQDDEACPFERAKAFAEANPGIVTFKPATRGGHYGSMIREGIPAGLQFLRSTLK